MFLRILAFEMRAMFVATCYTEVYVAYYLPVPLTAAVYITYLSLRGRLGNLGQSDDIIQTSSGSSSTLADSG